MSTSTRIRTVEVLALDIPLFAPFGISGGAQVAANNVLVSIQTEDGTLGYGEAAPLPAYNGETQAAASSVLREAVAWLVGREVRNWREIGREFARRSEGRSGAARCALETALLDAMCRHDGIPLWRFFGGAGTELETDMTVTTGSAAAAGAAAKDIWSRGIRTIKVKIGGAGSAEQDLARIRAINEAAPAAPLILDGNAGLSRDTATELVRGLRETGIVPALLEQWLAKDDLEGMAGLRRESGWLVAADESAVTPDDVRRIARAGAAQVVNIKLMKAGVAAAWEIAEVARAEGLDLMIGGNVESILAMTMSASFAAGVGGFRFADLDTPLFLAANPFVGGFTLDGDRISVAHIAAGHGVVPSNPAAR